MLHKNLFFSNNNSNNGNNNNTRFRQEDSDSASVFLNVLFRCAGRPDATHADGWTLLKMLRCKFFIELKAEGIFFFLSLSIFFSLSLSLISNTRDDKCCLSIT